MSEEANKELHQNKVNQQSKKPEESTENQTDKVDETVDHSVEKEENTKPTSTDKDEVKNQVEPNPDEKKPAELDPTENKKEEVQPATKQEQSTNDDDTPPTAEKAEHKAIDEMDDANAEDGEDKDVQDRHNIELKDYDAMSLDEIVLELEKLLAKEKIQAIREHVTQIKIAFDKKFNEIIEEKKESFIEAGGNLIDFQYASPVKKKFNSIYFEYREKRDQYYSQLKKNLNQNLKERLAIIEELKNIIGSGESMNTNFQKFKDLQERWKNAGSVPKSDYKEVWKNYHFHIERFYDFLHLDREFRDMDFKHNLDQKLKIIERAEELAKEEDLNRAFRELQLLHKMWKEELGPVAKEYREDIWERFSKATQVIHDKRQAYYDEMEKEYEKNLEVKHEVIEEIKKIAEQEVTSHRDAQTKMKHISKLREIFFKAGKVPRKNMNEVWDAFKKSTRSFNRKKNAFYKNLKQEQFKNLEKKLELVKIAEEHKDSEDFETITPLMKKIQEEWKKIGHVPRKDSDKIWKRFKKACNHYFDRLHNKKNENLDEGLKAFLAKKDLINQLKATKLKNEKEADLKTLKKFISAWSEIGSVPHNKKYVEGKFNRILDQLFNKIGIETQKAEMLKYETRLQDLDEGSDRDINREVFFLRKKIEETQENINQFENNLQFFSSKDDSNPLVKEVKDKIASYHKELAVWKSKLQKINEL